MNTEATDKPRVLHVLAVHPSSMMQGGVARVLERFAPTIDGIEGSVQFTMESVPNLNAAELLVCSGAFDILLLEAKPTDTGDIHLSGDLLAACHDTPIVLLTQSASIQAAVEATRQGAFDFLLQPFTAADLRFTLTRAARHVLLSRRAKELEEEKKRVRFDFIRVLGHELKAPLGAVTTSLGIFTNRYLGEDVAAYDPLIGRCQVRLDQMRKLIVDLLDMTRLESGQKQRDLVQLDLHAAVTDAVELMTPQAKQRGIRIHADVPDPCVLSADEGEINMILNNLISNAIKYNRDDGEVFVTVAAVAGGVSIAVRDTGIGMSPEEVSKLFGEFVRIRNKKTADILGSGLGLSILKRLAELYNGRVEVESVADVGSTFTVRLLPERDATPAGEGGP